MTPHNVKTGYIDKGIIQVRYIFLYRIGTTNVHAVCKKIKD